MKMKNCLLVSLVCGLLFGACRNDNFEERVPFITS